MIHPMSSAKMRRKQGPEWAIRQNSTLCRKMSKSVGFCRVGEGSSRAVGVAPMALICNGIGGGFGSRPRGAQRARQAKNRVSCRNVGCEAAAACRDCRPAGLSGPFPPPCYFSPGTSWKEYDIPLLIGPALLLVFTRWPFPLPSNVNSSRTSSLASFLYSQVSPPPA